MQEVIEVKFSRGVHALLKGYLKSNENKMPVFNREKLTEELKNGEVLTEKNIPEGVVSVNTSVKVLEEVSGVELNFSLVAPDKVKLKHNKLSILSPVGVALAGYKVGDVVDWEMPEGLRKYKILEVNLIQ